MGDDLSEEAVKTRAALVRRSARKLRLRIRRPLRAYIASQRSLEDEAALDAFVLRLKVFADGLRRSVSRELIDDALLPDEELVERELREAAHSPLFMAIEDGEATEVERLLAAGADLGDVSERHEGMTPLLLALFQHDADIASLLVNAGANPDDRGRHHLAPIHLASGHRRCLSVFLKAGPAVDALDENGRSALLRLASDDRHSERVAMLLEAGADPDLRDAGGLKAEEIARSSGADAIASLLSRS